MGGVGRKKKKGRILIKINFKKIGKYRHIHSYIQTDIHGIACSGNSRENCRLEKLIQAVC